MQVLIWRFNTKIPKNMHSTVKLQITLKKKKQRKMSRMQLTNSIQAKHGINLSSITQLSLFNIPQRLLPSLLLLSQWTPFFYVNETIRSSGPFLTCLRWLLGLHKATPKLASNMSKISQPANTNFLWFFFSNFRMIFTPILGHWKICPKFEKML